jgi:hypothetical protein
MAFLLTVTGNNPVAGAEVAHTLTEDLNKLIAVRFTLVTSAVAANRTVTIIVDDGTSVLWRKTSPAVQTASLTRSYVFLRDITDAGGFDGNGDMYLALPADLPLAAASRVRTSTALIDVGDNYGAPLLHLAQGTERDQVEFTL